MRALAAVLSLAVALCPGLALGPALVPGQLPEARYDAVLPALDARGPKLLTPASAAVPTWQIFTLRTGLDLYGAGRDEPVARLAARNFLGEPTVVLGFAERADGWRMVLTPARQQLPSRDPKAPAQTYAWVRSAQLGTGAAVRAWVEVVLDRGELVIHSTAGDRVFPAGIGAAGTPTPHGVTGYLQARYRDAAQGQPDHRIQLTSLHATGADEPYGGSDGGLIGIHLGAGASHGCIRISAAALAAVDALPLGTPVRIS